MSVAQDDAEYRMAKLQTGCLSLIFNFWWLKRGVKLATRLSRYVPLMFVDRKFDLMQEI
jgi:hypothetical protein